MTNFVIYLIGTLLVVAGLARRFASRRESGLDHCRCARYHRPGLMGGIVKTRQKDPAS